MFGLTSRFGTVSAHFGVSGAFFGVREDSAVFGPSSLAGDRADL